MRYFYDTEFIEDGRTIDLLSIGIVCEDGRELYLENSEADTEKASPWVVENVLPYLHSCLTNGGPCQEVCPMRLRSQIAEELRAFCDPEKYGKPEFWGYYSAYDHVVLCQLFGPMIELPKGWPMYTRDLKQWAVMLGDPKLPDQGKGEHHALADARWNKSAWRFLLALNQKPGEGQ